MKGYPDKVLIGSDESNLYAASVSSTSYGGGVTHLAHQPDDYLKSMVAYQTATYATGWMNGEIKGAFLSDTDTANLVGSGELISNGGFDEDTTGWDGVDGASISVENNRLKVINTTPTYGDALQTIATEVGKVYQVTASLLDGSAQSRLIVRDINADGTILLSIADGYAAETSVLGYFRANSSVTAITITPYSNNIGNYCYADNISVKLADADRSVNNNGLVVSSKTYDPWHDDLNLAFDDESFTVDREASDFMSAITHDASSNATMTGSYGPELVTNGDFSDGSTGWININGTFTVTDEVAYFAYESVGGIGQTLQTETGKVYEISFTVPEFDGSLRFSPRETDINGTIVTNQSIAASGMYKFTFEATSSSTLIYFQLTDGGYYYIDNISIREIPKVQWRPHNLLKYSEDFTEWSTSGTITVTADDTTAPDGATTADKVAFGSSIFDAVWQSSAANAGQTLTFSVWAKADSATTVRLRIWDTDTGSQYSSDLAVGTSWTLITHTATIGSASTTTNYGIYNNSTSTTSDIHIWGAHLYRNDLGGMAPVPTDFQTAGSTTYVRTAGREVTGTELVTNGTFDSDASGWSIGSDAALSAVSGQLNVTTTAPDNISAAYQAVTVEVGKAYQFTATRVSQDNDSAWGVATTTTSSRDLVEFAYNATGTKTGFFVAPATTVYVQLWSASDTVTDGVSIYDNISIKEIDVDPSTARYLPRLGHHVYNGSAWVNEGLLHESEARTNLVTYSQDFSQWDTSNTPTVTSDAATSPDGTENAVSLLANGTGGFQQIIENVTLSDNTDCALSVYFKAAVGNSGVRLALTGKDNVTRHFCATSSGDIGSLSYQSSNVTMQEVGNGWYRLSGVVNSASGAGQTVVRIYPTDSSGDVATLVSGDGIYIWGAQVEAASTPSSYIPTSGATATRASESLTIPAANLPYSSTAMTIQMDGRVTYADEGAYSTSIGVSWRKDADNFIITMDCSTNSADTGRVFFSQEANSVYDAVSEPGPGSYSPDILVPFNIASRHGSTFINGAVDGVALTANTTPTALPDLSSTDLSLGNIYNGTIRNFRMWGNDIKDDGIEIVTQPSIAPSLSLSFDGSEASQVEFDWSKK